MRLTRWSAKMAQSECCRAPIGKRCLKDLSGLLTRTEFVEASSALEGDNETLPEPHRRECYRTLAIGARLT
jgi:hypothetical protein